MKNFKRMLIIALSTLFVLQVGMPANAQESEQNQTTVRILSTAGENGYYLFDIDTDTETFIPTTDDMANEIVDPVPATDDLLIEDNISSISPLTIVGSDNRTKITTPSGKTVSTCRIISRFPDDTRSAGTGWLINNSYLATAAHVVYSHDHGGQAKHVAVYVGASGGTYKQYVLGHVHAVGGDYVKYGKDMYSTAGMFDDWAVVKFDYSINDVGRLGKYGVNSYSDMKDRTYETQGYPADKNSSISKWDDYYMYHTTGKITGDKYRFLDMVRTDLDITAGQSGSPIYSYRTGYGYCAEGIVVAGGTNGAEENYILLLNNWLLSYFQKL